MEKIKNLDLHYSYDLKIPIRKKEDFDQVIDTIPMDSEWKEQLQTRWWATNFTGNLTPREKYYLHLRKKLLAFGGEQVCLYPDEDHNKIMERGQLWLPDRMEFELKDQNRCHQNCAYKWKENPDRKFTIATGYALSKDGMWRLHSWLVERKPRSTTIIETTSPRIAYFGYVMTLEECQEFYEKVCY